MNNHNDNGGAWKVDPNNENRDPLFEISVSLDDTFDVLAHPERRTILEFLMKTTCGTVTLTDMVRHLQDRNAYPTDDASDKETITTRVHHSHLPKLADVGIIDYDDRSQEVRYYCDERLEEWLRHAITETDE